MTPDIVVDVGNTAVKWGLCSRGGIATTVRLAANDENQWSEQAELWSLGPATQWMVTGVQPTERDRLAEWIRRRGAQVQLIDDPKKLPLKVQLARPDQVGIDRLLDAVAANARRQCGQAAVVIDAGTAVTVDWLDHEGVFHGGAILPGLRLMALALHKHTAMLPLIEMPQTPPSLPGKSTREAMQLGVFWSVIGGVRALVEEYCQMVKTSTAVFVTGGDGAVLQQALKLPLDFWPHMTLEGIRLAAEALP